MSDSSTLGKFNLLPAGAAPFVRRRLVEGGGFALLLLAFALGLALASFDPADPSGNTAGGEAARNWLGAPGAWSADFLLQGIGLAAVTPIPVLLVWGWHLISHRGIRWLGWRLAALIVMLASAALLAATFDVPTGWPLRAGLGGLAGDGLVAGVDGAFAALETPVRPRAVAGATGLLGLAAWLLALGLDRGEWLGVGRGLARLVGVTWRGVRAGGERLRDLFAGLAARRASRRRITPAFADDEPSAYEDDDTVSATAPKRSRRVVKRKDKEKAPKGKRAQAAEQSSLDLGPVGDYQLPPLDLLAEADPAAARHGVNEEALEQNARLLETVLDDYGVRGRIIKVRPGPVVTLYELEPAPGTKSSRVIGLADDIARSMSAISVRVAVVPGRNVIGIELPNRDRETVLFRELLASRDFEDPNISLGLALGRDIGGAPIMADLARMPHLLIAGTTGSGKSVAINTMILSLLYRLPPERCRMIMIDPKMLELSVYDDIPHLLTPVVTDPGKAVVALKWTVREMETRYKAMARLGVRNISGYNQRLAEARAKDEKLTRTVQTGFDPETGKPIFEQQMLDLEPMPFIVVVVDEMADLMMVAGKDIEGAIQRLAQMARAAGIHLIMATQRPSVDVITGTIKANFPTRISFQVTSKIDSRTILGEMGAEQLLGQGDMLYMAGGGRITRVHGPFVSDGEVERIATYLRGQGEPDYLDAVTDGDGEDMDGGFGGGGMDGTSGDDLYDRAIDVVARHRKASTSFIQRQLKIGYNRAADLIDRMEADGVIGQANHAGKREIFVRDPSEDL